MILGKVARFAKSLATNNMTRATVGMGAGSIYGAATTEGDTLSGALRGGILGGAIGGGMIPLIKQTPSILSAAGGAGFGVAKYALNHPFQAMGAVGGVAGLSYLNSNYGSIPQQEVYMDDPYSQSLQELQTGVSPMGSIMSGISVRNNQLMSSTQNLVQGLHRGRH